MFKRLLPHFLLPTALLFFSLMTFSVVAQNAPAISVASPSVSPATPVSTVATSAPQPTSTPVVLDATMTADNEVIPEPDDESTGAPVILSGRTLFYIYADSSIYSAAQRADIVS